MSEQFLSLPEVSMLMGITSKFRDDRKEQTLNRLRRIENRSGKKLLHVEGEGTRRRYWVSRAALARHAPELFRRQKDERYVTEAADAVRRELESFGERYGEKLDDLVARHRAAVDLLNTEVGTLKRRVGKLEARAAREDAERREAISRRRN